MKILNAELPFDTLDADDMERAESCIAQAKIRTAGIKGEQASLVIRATCREIFECFNGIFGDGTDKKLFGGKTNMGVCLEAFAQLCESLRSESVGTISDIKAKYMPSRTK